MARTPKLQVKKPVSVFFKPIEVDFKDVFKALAKGIGHTATGKWVELAGDAVEGVSALGLKTEPEELAYLLIRRSLVSAIFELVGESASLQLSDVKKDNRLLASRLDFTISGAEAHIDGKFLDRPDELPLIKKAAQLLRNWLEALGISEASASAIVRRLPTYFAYALNQEWRKNSKSYKPLLDALNTPFTKASDREWAWMQYAALLQRRINEGVFDEAFGLSQIYVPLNAYYIDEKTGKDSSDEIVRSSRLKRRVVISVEQELEIWLNESTPQTAIRVLSGGPGSGKSSFARIFAAHVANTNKTRVLFVPLHLIDPSKDLVEEVGRFVKDEGVLLQNPLDTESPELNLLIIFDGLDELANQGQAAAETARAFIREVERTVDKRNLQETRVRVLISGRELVVQENESEFRRPRQVLNLLPYFIARSGELERGRLVVDNEHYDDPQKLLKHDLRQTWWKNYGMLTGKSYKGLPAELSRSDLDDVTSQPLLNYLVALSFTRDQLDFTKDINLNSVYADLVTAVHERGYEKRRPYAPIRHMSLDNFSRVLEEVGLAAWHGDGRTTTVQEIEEHCRISGVGSLLDVFKEGARAGVTKLLAAFFFRQYGQRPSGDPTFVFTHKSFGEYLTCRRIVRAVERMVRELDRRSASPDEGWDEREALKHWAQVCGPSGISRYLHKFILDELRLRDVREIRKWGERLVLLFNYMLLNGMPMEQLEIRRFRETLFQSRNAEEALLVAVNGCARLSERPYKINHPDPTAFAIWFKRIQGQRVGAESALAAECLSFIDLSDCVLHMIDFYNSNLTSARLRGIQASYTCFGRASLSNANLERAQLFRSDFEGARLVNANLKRAGLHHCYFAAANLSNANLTGAELEEADFRGANLSGTNLKNANLAGADLRSGSSRFVPHDRTKLDGANLEGANLDGANLGGTPLSSAKLGKPTKEGQSNRR